MSPEVQEIYDIVAGGLVYLMPTAVLLKIWWDEHKEEKEKARQNKKAP